MKKEARNHRASKFKLGNLRVMTSHHYFFTRVSNSTIMILKKKIKLATQTRNSVVTSFISSYDVTTLFRNSNK